MTEYLTYLTRRNIATALILTYVAIGAVVVITGGMTLEALVQLLDAPVAALVVGAGLTTIAFTRAAPGETVLGIAALLVIAYAIIGAIQVVSTDLTFEAYLKLMDLPVAGLAIGKGLFANNVPPVR